MSHNLRITARTEKSPTKTQNTFQIQGGSKLEVFDEDGGKLYEGEFKSFTANFLKLLYGSMVGSGTAKAKDLTNTDLAMDSFPQNTFNISGGADVKKFGVVVGTNTAAVSVSDYNITVPASLTLNATAVGASSVGADSISVEISRQIGNSTGSTVNLKEAGLICGSEDETDTNVLIARDLLDVTLENGKKSVWRYTINFNFANDVGGFVKTFADKMFGKIFEKMSDIDILNNNRVSFGCCVFDNKIWVLGGTTNYSSSGTLNDVWYSFDGVNWTRATSSANWNIRYDFQSVVFDDKIWVLGGFDGSQSLNDVWYSFDGVNWTRATSSAGWDVRRNFCSIVYDNKIWVLGGTPRYPFTTFNNDVWYSFDGVNWTRATSSANWSGRMNFGCLVFDNKMWILGGSSGDGNLNDVWYSSDGITWTQATHSASFIAGDSTVCTVIDNLIYLFRGSNLYISYDCINWLKISSETTSFNYLERFNQKIIAVKTAEIWQKRNTLSTFIFLGSSDSSFSAMGTALDSLIANGSGSGQLVYGTMPGAATTEPTTSGNKTKFSIAREFTNNSGADITVREVGLFSGSDMLARLILAQPVVIPNGESEVISVDFETEV